MRAFVLASCACLLALTLPAENRVGTLQLADSASIVRSIRRLAGLLRDPSISEMAPELVNTLPTARYFGRGRPGASTVFVLLGGTNEACRTAVLYPVAVTPEAFVKAHPGAKRLKDGVISVPRHDDCEECAAEVSWPYVVFSGDSRWAGGGDTAEDARLALKEVAAAERPMSNVLVRVSGNAADLSALLEQRLKNDVTKSDLESQPMIMDASKLSDLFAELRMGPRGIDLEYWMQPKDASAFSDVGKTSLPADALAPAETNAVIAYAKVEKMPSENLNIESMVKMMQYFRGEELKYACRKGHYGASFAVEGSPLQDTALTQRFDLIMPEYKAFPLQSKLIMVPHLMVPPPVAGSRRGRVIDRKSEGLAFAGWCKDGRLHGIIRITADEIAILSKCMVANAMSMDAEPLR